MAPRQFEEKVERFQQWNDPAEVDDLWKQISRALPKPVLEDLKVGVGRFKPRMCRRNLKAALRARPAH
jgi:hypothetical protein